MNMRRTLTTRVEENDVHEEISPQVEKVKQVLQGGQGTQGAMVYLDPIVDGGNDVSVISPDLANGEIRDDLIAQARAMTNHITRDVGPKVNALECTMTSRLRDFVRMNPPIFIGSKVG